MRCPVCNGVGMVENPRSRNIPSWKLYEDGIPTMIECKRCGGYGYKIDEISDVIPTLEMAVNERRGLTAKETKQILTTLLSDTQMKPTINVKIKLEAGGVLPTKGTPGSAAYDVYLPCDYTIIEGRQILPLNFRMEMPDGYEAMIEPRSGFSSKGMEGYTSIWNDPVTGKLMTQGYGRFDCDAIPGKVDSDYRGIVGVIVINRGEPFVMREGTRIAQMTIRRVENADFTLTDELSTTERGAGGFGHTNETTI